MKKGEASYEAAKAAVNAGGFEAADEGEGAGSVHIGTRAELDALKERDLSRETAKAWELKDFIKLWGKQIVPANEINDLIKKHGYRGTGKRVSELGDFDTNDKGQDFHGIKNGSFALSSGLMREGGRGFVFNLWYKNAEGGLSTVDIDTSRIANLKSNLIVPPELARKIASGRMNRQEEKTIGEDVGWLRNKIKEQLEKLGFIDGSYVGEGFVGLEKAKKIDPEEFDFK